MTEDKSIRGHIDWLARRTGAPQSFIQQVRALFRNKGISLDAEAAPYLAALEEAFRREAAVRDTAGRARRSIAELQAQFTRIGASYRQQLAQLRRIRSSLDSSSAGGQRRKRSGSPGATVIATNGRVVVTGPQKDGHTMVPGPDDLQ